jgi:acetyl esterase/lipase
VTHPAARSDTTEAAAVPVAQQFETALAALGEVMPVDISVPGGIAAYRRAAESRATTAESVALRCGLSTHERISNGLPVTVFRPTEPAVARVLFLHGGGLIAGNRFDGVDIVARHASELRLEIWSVEYPLAPELTFGASAELVLAVAGHAGDSGMRVLIAGQSAGGGIAAEVALRAASRGVRIDGQLLVCPMLARIDDETARRFENDRAWSATNSTVAWTAALGDSADIPPGERPHLPALAPTYLDAGSAELFRRAITDFASALWQRGNRAELHVWSGGFHAFDCAAEDASCSSESHRVRGDWMRRWLRGEL